MMLTLIKTRAVGAQRSVRATVRRAFTLTELMIAVALLVVVILASAKIFGIASDVAATGEATTDVMQDIAAIERQIRADIASLSQGGFFAIRSVSVRNDATTGRLLNPNLPIDGIIRADQLVFFREGLTGSSTFRDGGSGTNNRTMSTVSRIYYGHAIQLPGAIGFSASTAPTDPSPTFAGGDTLFPWSVDPGPRSLQMFNHNTGGAVNPQVSGTQPPAREWLLARQQVMLADDGGSEFVYLNDGDSAADIWDRLIALGRVDIAASLPSDIRNFVQFVPTSGAVRPWNDASFGDGDQRSIISSAINWPRAERFAPSMDRVDHALTTSVIGSACSSFRVDWAYENGDGGYVFPAFGPTPWIGLPNADGTRPLLSWIAGTDGYIDDTDTFVDELNLERQFAIAPGVRGYEALFGYNRGLTPWPSAIRVTLTLHDVNTKLENGREYQFVVKLPRREG